MSSNQSNVKTSKKRQAQLVVFVVLVCIAVILLSQCVIKSKPGIPTPESVADIAMIDLVKATRDELQAPGLTIADVTANLKTEKAIIAFVQNDVRYTSYVGRLQDPKTVLKTRTANAADKAILLQELLLAIGIETRAKIGPEWPAGETPYAAPPKFNEPPSLRKLLVKIGYNIDDWRSELTEQMEVMSKKVDTIRDETDQSINLISQTLTLDFSAPVDLRGREVDWVWLERRGGKKFIDPTFPKVARPDDALLYDENVPETHIAINITDENNRRQNILQWSGRAYGMDTRIGFLPATDTIERLKGNPDPSDIDVWLPFIGSSDTAVRGEPFTIDGASLQNLDADMPFTLTGNNIEIPDLVKITDLSIQKVSLENWPRVDLTLKVGTMGKPNWVASHFNLTENGIRKPIRVDSIYSQPAPVIVIADVSGSMANNGKFEMIRDIGTGLVNQLNDAQRLAIVTFGDGVRVKRLLSPLNRQEAPVDPTIWQAPIGGTMDYLSAIERALNIVDVDLQTGEPARIVLITDGSLKKSESKGNITRQEKILKRLEAATNIRLFPVGVGVKNSQFLRQVAETSGGVFLSVNPGSDSSALYDWLGGALAGQIKISYRSSGVAPDTVAQLALDISNNEKIASAEFIVPSDGFGNASFVELEIATGAVTVRRTLVDLNTPQSRWRLIGDYQVYLTPGAYPADIIAARYMDTWLNAIEIQLNDKPSVSFGSNMSFAHVATVNGHLGLSSLALDNSVKPYFPAIYLMKTAPGIVDGKVYQIRSIDIPRNGPWASNTTSTSANLHSGLIAASAEAQLLSNAQSVNANLINNADTLQLIDNMVPDNDNELQIITSANAPNSTWVINTNTGNILPIDTGFSVISKGTNVAEIAKEFDKVDKLYESIANWGGVGISAAGMPYSQPFAAFIGFLRTQNKMWCYATVMLGYVGNAIESEDALLNQSPQSAEAKAKELCKMDFDPEEFGREVVTGIAKDWAKAWASDAVAGAIQKDLGSAIGGSASSAYTAVTGGKPSAGWVSGVKTVWNGVPGSTASTGGGVSSWVAGGAVNFITSRAVPAPIPMTRGFHNAMSKAITEVTP